MKKLFAIMSHLQTHYRVKLEFQKVDQHRIILYGGSPVIIWVVHIGYNRSWLWRLNPQRKFQYSGQVE